MHATPFWEQKIKSFKPTKILAKRGKFFKFRVSTEVIHEDDDKEEKNKEREVR